jgi:hypothetical protein
MCRRFRRGAPGVFLIGDLPFVTYEVTTEDAIRNACRFMAECGCDAVKLEGGRNRAAVVKALVDASISVVGHIGFTPQPVAPKSAISGYLRSVAAINRNAALALGSVTREYITTFVRGSRGRPNLAPMSMALTGAARRARTATAKPALIASEIAATPLAMKTSRHGRFAASSARTVMARTPRGGAKFAIRNVSPECHLKEGDANQAYSSSAKISPPTALLTYNQAFEPALVEGFEEFLRQADTDLKRQSGIALAQAGEKGR